MPVKKPLLLIILDGFGYSFQTTYNAIAHAHTPHLHKWFAQYPHVLLKASGTAVGLLEGYIGNSQVGHLTIGAGRVIPQPISIIHQAIKDGSFFTNPLLTTCLENIAYTGSTLHLMGLLSDAGVHSHITHIYAYIRAAQQCKVKKIILHLFLDGRDTPPQSCIEYLIAIENYIKDMPSVKIGSLHGRFYAMDRDKNWERIEQSYKVLTEKQIPSSLDWKQLIYHYYTQGITDEFIPPTLLHADATIAAGDSIIFFNIRPDRARQLTSAFVSADFSYFPKSYIPISWFITSIDYGIKNIAIVFPTPPIINTLKEALSHANKIMLSIAETEKYAHVTYFFAGGYEHPFAGERQVLIPSLPQKTYVNHPRMSADTITSTVIQSLNADNTDFYLINYANADMVGHSGDMAATIRAIECLDEQLGQLYQIAIYEKKGTMIITGDHGKAEKMFNIKADQPYTAHTANPVPFLYIAHTIDSTLSLTSLHELADIAPFILNSMGIAIPPEMCDDYRRDFSK